MKLKNILEANICAFGQTIFDMSSLEDDEFVRALDYYLNQTNFEEILEDYAYKFVYDTGDIQNICDNCVFRNKKWDYVDIMDCSRLAFIKTINEDKTIDAQAFADNIVNEFKRKIK